MKSRERLTDIVMSFDEGAVIYGYRLNGEAIAFFGKDGLLPSGGASRVEARRPRLPRR